VTQVHRDWVEVDGFDVEIKAGDGVVFENLEDTNDEQGGRIFEVLQKRLTFQRGRLETDRLAIGTCVYKTGDPALEKRLRQTFEGDIPQRKLWKLDVSASGGVGQPLVLKVDPTRLRGCGGELEPIELRSRMSLEVARKRPLNEAVLRDQLGRLGGTCFELGDLSARFEGDGILPLSELNRMRREVVDVLESVRPDDAIPGEKATLESMLHPLKEACALPRPQATPELRILCRTQAQVKAALDAGISRIYADFEDIRLYADLVKSTRGHAGSEIWLATPRIQKSGEAGFFKLIERAEPEGVLIRNLGAIAYFRELGLPITGDFSLNVANPLTAEFLREQGLKQLTISYDLNFDQVMDLLRGAPPEWFEVTLHQHMPMFHMEHCAFAAFLSEGTDFTNCGRPCEKHDVRLRDRTGMEHPLKADVGCRNTLFNAVAQTGAEFYETMLGEGLRSFRVELLDESGPAAADIIRVYQELIAGRRSGMDLWKELRARSQLGVTRGTLSELPGKLDVSSPIPHFDVPS
jgi:putative protease